MKIITFFLSLFFLITSSIMAQSIEKVYLNPKNADDYYLAVKPPSKEIMGVIVLLPGFGESPESIFPETKIHNVAYLHGILTIGLGVGNKIFADKPVIDKINEVIRDALKKY